MTIGFIGSQKGMTDFQKSELIKLLASFQCSEFIHGDCIGADAEAHDLAKASGVSYFTIYPPEDPKKRAYKDNRERWDRTYDWYQFQGNKGNYFIRWHMPLPYLKRNRLIVDASALLIATPKEFKNTMQSGTWSTIRYGWLREKKDPNFKVIVIPPK